MVTFEQPELHDGIYVLETFEQHLGISVKFGRLILFTKI